MKKTTVKTKAVCTILSAICACSTLSILGTSAALAAETKPATTVSEKANDSAKATDKTQNKQSKKSPFFADFTEGEKEFYENSFNKSKKVTLLMVKTFLEKVIDKHLGKTAYGAIAVGIKNVMKDLLFEEEKQMSSDTKILREDISRLSDQISSNHAEVLAILEKLEKQIGIEGFKNRLHEVKTDYTFVTGKIDKLGAELGGSEDKVIDEAAYNKLKAVLSNSGIDSSKLSRTLLSTALDIAPVYQENLDTNDAAAVKAYLDKNAKSALVTYRQYLLSKQRASNIDCDFGKAIDYNSTIKNINTVNEDIYQTCLMDYTTILTLSAIEYKVAEYEHRGKSDLQANLDTVLQNINDVSNSINRIAQMNRAIKATNNEMALAKVKIDKAEKTFVRFDEAWATAANSGKNATVTLIADIKGDSARGLNISKLAKGAAFSANDGLKVKNNITLDLNGHTIDLGGNCTGITVEPGATFAMKNGVIKNGGKAFEFADKKNKNKTDVKIENVTFDGFKKGGFDIDAGDKFNLNLKNCTVKNVAGGSGINSKNYLKASLENCKFEKCYSPKYGGAVCVMRAKNVDFKNCTFTENKAKLYGGAIYAEGSPLKINGCTFTKNSIEKSSGGAVYTEADAFVKGCTFTGNNAPRNGGAICTICNTKLVLEDSKFTGNNARNGSAVYLCSLFTTHHEFKDVNFTKNLGFNTVYAASGKFKFDAADIDLRGYIICSDNEGIGIQLTKKGGKAMLFTKSDFNSSASKVYVYSNQHDVAVVDLNQKAHESAFASKADIYRGTFHNYTLYFRYK